nr:MAG TPA: hypothetical protein [Caudoviricetes sp.]
MCRNSRRKWFSPANRVEHPEAKRKRGRVRCKSSPSAPKEESRCPESAARCSPPGRVKSAM